MKHTPGPWYALGQAVNVDREGMAGLACIAKAHQRRGTDLVPITKAEAEANARLIASAPELLAALSEIEAHHVEQNRAKGRPESRSRTLRVVRAAIAKAEGPPPDENGVGIGTLLSDAPKRLRGEIA